jgi:exodeoxyribonuclease VIII
MSSTQRTGLIRGLPASEYHAEPDEVSNTMLSAMHKSAAHCYALHLAPYRPKREPTDAMLAGTLAHTAVLEPEALHERYVVKPAGMRFSTKEGMSWRDAQTTAIISRDDMEGAEAQRAAVYRIKSLANLLSAGDAEASVFWKDAATGLRCRARPDWLHWHGPKRATVLDIKTISDLTPDAVQRAVGAYGYHRQAAHYTAGLNAIGIDVEEFVFGFVSSSYPFLAASYVLDDETAQQGRDEVAELLSYFALCKQRDEWPAFGDGYQLTGLPTWAKRSSEVEVSYV